MPKVTRGGARNETPEGERSLEVSGNLMGRGLWTWGLACAEREGPGVRGWGVRGTESGGFSTSESSASTVTL